MRPCGSAGLTPSSRGGKRPRLSISVGEGTVEIGDLFISSNSPSGGMSTRRTARDCQASLSQALLSRKLLVFFYPVKYSPQCDSLNLPL